MRNAIWVGGGITGMGEIPMLGVREKGIAKVIRDIFRNGEQGFFYDPNDLSTMYQDATGNVPVTGVGQPVGLMLDKSKGLLLGPNLATITSVTGGGVGGTEFKTVTVSRALAAGSWYKINIKVSNYSGSGDLGITGTNTAFPISNVPSGIRARSSNGLISFIALAQTNNTITLYTRASNNADFTDITIQKIAGNHTYQTTSASRPILRQNATTGAYYLEFDGTDDFLQTSNIDFTATNKISLFAGVQKMPATTVNMLCELSSSSTADAQSNAFYLAVPETSGGTIFFRSRATASSSQIAKVESGSGMRNCVITAKSDIPNDLNTVSIDGVLGTPSSVDLGVGNLGNYPLYIGRRGGVSFSFNGHIYSLIGVGKLASDNVTIAIEKELAKRTGVTLNV